MLERKRPALPGIGLWVETHYLLIKV
jgi:hypothetical protein